MTQENPGDVSPSLQPGYEVRDTNVRAIVLFTVGLIGMILLVQLGLWSLLESIRDGRSARSTPLTSPAMIAEQRKQLDTRENETLRGYGWVDRKRGTVRIPIDKAIDLLAEQGLPPTGAPARTEVDVNSHSGTAVAPDSNRRQEKGKDDDKKGAKP